ncbi:CLOCK-interacting pacemaker isoform X2 [Bombina bombina]|uniref:CLOCK-interacting pacemaker isoform X2 n=1 Tax=Bombina bombina TaxID=8345 RepID=UPI00235B125C|nr:CLOCK-interacting pacemaker isoform X2 [Bombina bombina]
MEKRPHYGPFQDRRQSRPKQQLQNTGVAPESDSGYSDVTSECLSSVEQTDSEECGSALLWTAAETPSGNPQPHPLDSCPDPHIHSWTAHPSFQILPASSQILLFPSATNATKPQPPCNKDTKYLPILNSYTKIAPQPSVLSPKLPVPSKKEQRQTKRPCPEASGSDSSKASEARVRFGEIQRDTIADFKATAGSCNDNVSIQDNVNRDSKVVSYINNPQLMPKEQPVVLAEKRSKTRRFQNTLDVLHSSGLLGIAMKTKELARLNQATQYQLERLQEQVQLYVKAVGSNHPQDWQKLQDSLAGAEQGTTADPTFKEM